MNPALRRFASIRNVKSSYRRFASGQASVKRYPNDPMHTKIYNLVFRNTSTMLLAIIGGAFVAEIFIDSTVNTIWKMSNRGKSFNDMMEDRKSKGLLEE